MRFENIETDAEVSMFDQCEGCCHTDADSPDDVIRTQRGSVICPVVRQRGGLQCIMGPHHPHLGRRDGRDEVYAGEKNTDRAELTELNDFTTGTVSDLLCPGL